MNELVNFKMNFELMCVCVCVCVCVQVLLKPLQALCSFQLQHGAQVHHSKEQLIRSGQYNKILPKNKRKIRRMQRLLGHDT